MKKIVMVLVFCFGACLTAQEVYSALPIATFRALSENEVLAVQGDWMYPEAVYAQNIENLEDIRQLTAIDSNSIGGYSITNDRKTIVYSEYSNTDNVSVYIIQGKEGTVKHLFNTSHGNFRISSDGKYLLYETGPMGLITTEVVLYDLEKEIVLQTFKPTVKENVDEAFFVINRYYNNMFELIYETDMGIKAVFDIDPITQDMQVRWDKTEEYIYDQSSVTRRSERGNKEWLDPAEKIKMEAEIK